jgi:nucleoid DNA-binding protein
MKLKECNEQIAKECGLTPKAVAAVHAETFRLITEALEKGERVFVPEFGVFTVKDIEATGDQPAKKMVRFRQRGEEEKPEDGEAKDGNDRKDRKKRKAEAAADAASEPAAAEAAE